MRSDEGMQAIKNLFVESDGRWRWNTHRVVVCRFCTPSRTSSASSTSSKRTRASGPARCYAPRRFGPRASNFSRIVVFSSRHHLAKNDQCELPAGEEARSQRGDRRWYKHVNAREFVANADQSIQTRAPRQLSVDLTHGVVHFARFTVREVQRKGPLSLWTSWRGSDSNSQ
jgi:hypothetical protein